MGSLHDAAALLTVQMHFVDVGLMKLDVFRNVDALFLQLLNGTDAFSVSAGTFPDWKWRSPVSVSGDAPVDDIFKELTHSACSDIVRIPVDAVGVLQQFVSE